MAKLIPGEWGPEDPGVHASLVRNLMKRTKEFTPETKASGGKWYGEAQADAAHFGDVTRTDITTGGAAIGRLSGGTEYNLNRLMALQIPRLTPIQSRAVRTAGRLSAEGAPAEEVRKVRTAGGLERTPLWHQSARMGLDALRLAHGEFAPEPTDVFGGRSTTSNKTLDFGLGVSTGGRHPSPPIDTHAYDAAHDSYQIPYGTAMSHTSKVGVYDAVQNAYASAHQKSLKAGLIPEDTTLADYQAMHWVHHIANKRVVNKRSATSAKAGETIIGNIVRHHPDLDPAKHGLPRLSTSQDLSGSVISRNQHFGIGSGEGR